MFFALRENMMCSVSLSVMATVTKGGRVAPSPLVTVAPSGKQMKLLTVLQLQLQ